MVSPVIGCGVVGHRFGPVHSHQFAAMYDLYVDLTCHLDTHVDLSLR